MAGVQGYTDAQWRRQVSEFWGGGAFEGQCAFGGGKIEFHEIFPPPRCQKFFHTFFPKFFPGHF